ncbi:MAG: iron donor protein CyaY [Planctomycetota bacterium]|nr:MAG: iron donor protein CyaY [Planctomycetota bacterium]
MNEQEFKNLATQCLQRVEDWAEDFEPEEMDYEPMDGLIKLEFPGSKCFVLNRQAGNYQMWYAAGAHAWHYDWDPESGAWLNDRDGHNLFDCVRATVAEKLGREVPEIGG